MSDDEFVMISKMDHEIRENNISKGALEELLQEKINFKLQVEWFNEWHGLLCDITLTKYRGQCDKRWPIISNDLPVEDRTLLQQKEKEFQNVWESLQSHSLLINQIRSLHKMCTDVKKVKRQRPSSDYLADLKESVHQLIGIERHIEQMKQHMKDLNETALAKELSDTRNKLERMTRDKDEAITRLSKLAGDKLRHNNASIADLSDRNRPTCLAEKYNELYDNEWSDVFNQMTKSPSDEKNTIAVLLDVLKQVYKECDVQASSQRANLYNVLQLHFPSEGSQIYENREDNDSSTTDDDDQILHVQRQITELQKATADFTILKITKILKTTLTTYGDTFDLGSINSSAYLDRCIDLCWYMNIQERRVVLQFDFIKGTEFNTKVFRPYTRCGNTSEYLVWPSMFLYEGGPLLQKGVMQPESPS